MQLLHIVALFLPAMAQCSNFVRNVAHQGMVPVSDDLVVNSDLIQDMASSPNEDRYVSPTEIDIGGGYTIKLENNEKNLYKSNIICEADTIPSFVITAINVHRGVMTPRIGMTVSNNYGLHMSPDRGFQFYKRIVYDSSSEEEDDVEKGSQLDKRYGYRCTNKNIAAPKTCGNNIKSGNPVNSAHNCPGKGYECTFPQGPNGNSYGICCYSIKTARSCGFEGGYCFLDKVKNTCGDDCLN